MKKEPTYEELLAEIAILRDQNKRKDELIAYLQRLLYGTKSDRLASKVPENQPGLFDELFQEAMMKRLARLNRRLKILSRRLRGEDRPHASLPHGRPNTITMAWRSARQQLCPKVWTLTNTTS